MRGGNGVLVQWLAALVVCAAVLGCDDKDGDEDEMRDAGPMQSDAGFVFDPIELEGRPRGLTAFRFLPDRADELLALTKGGELLHYTLEGDEARVRGEVQVPNVHTESDCGLISLVFDPEFETNHYVYLGQCFSETESGIVRIVFDPTDYEGIEDTAVEIIRLGDPRAMRSWHNVGRIGFEPDGVMWALFGEKNVRDNAQNPESPLGALLRIRPHMDEDGGYDPVGGEGPIEGMDHPAVYARGFRSPWTGIRDSRGRYWVGDVGSGFIEEVNVIEEPGGNYGWALSEGPCTSEECNDTVDPVLSWDRSDDHPYVLEDPYALTQQRRVVWIALEYEDRGNDRYEGKLTNKVLYGDLCMGFVRAAQMSETGEVTDEAVGHLPYASAWDQGADGFIYAVTFGRCHTGSDSVSGKLYRLNYRSQ